MYLVSVRLLNRELCRPRSSHDLINQRGGLPTYHNKVWSKAYQATGAQAIAAVPSRSEGQCSALTTRKPMKLERIL